MKQRIEVIILEGFTQNWLVLYIVSYVVICFYGSLSCWPSIVFLRTRFVDPLFLRFLGIQLPIRNAMSLYSIVIPLCLLHNLMFFVIFLFGRAICIFRNTFPKTQMNKIADNRFSCLTSAFIANYLDSYPMNVILEVVCMSLFLMMLIASHEPETLQKF